MYLLKNIPIGLYYVREERRLGGGGGGVQPEIIRTDWDMRRGGGGSCVCETCQKIALLVKFKILTLKFWNSENVAKFELSGGGRNCHDCLWKNILLYQNVDKNNLENQNTENFTQL